MTLESRTWAPEDLDALREGACVAGECGHTVALPPLPRRAAMWPLIKPPVTLWAMSVTGSEPVPTSSFREALDESVEFNIRALNAGCVEGVFAAPCVWPHMADQHAKGIADALAERARRAVDLELGSSGG